MITLSPRDKKDEESQLPDAKYSISSLASAIHYNCKKHIYLLSRRVLNKARVEDNLKNAHCERGNVFEEELFEKHKAAMIDHTHSTDFKKALHDAKPNTYLYQLKFKLPESFYSDVIKNTKSYRINNFIPDFLYIHQDPITNIRKILIIDAKSSKEMSKPHQFQVASYAFFLQYLIKDIRNLEVDGLGGVWLPNNLEKPVTFRIDLVIEKVKFIYLDTLINISNNPNPEWVLGKKCNSCQFINQCKQDAGGTVRSIPYMNEAKVTRLKENSLIEIEDLSELLQNLKIDNKTSVSNDNDYDNVTDSKLPVTGYEHYVDAYTYKKAQFMGYASVKVADNVDHNIYIYLQVDNYSQLPFAYRIEAIEVITDEKIFQKVFVTDYEGHLKDKLTEYSDFIDNFVEDLVSVLELMHELKSRCLFYVYNSQEKKVIQNILSNLISSEGKDLISLDESRKKEIISNVMRCLVVLFQDTQLLGLPGIVNFPEMDDIQRTSSVGRFVCIEEILQENIALGVPGFYDIVDAVKWMASSYLNGKNKDITSGFDLGDIYSSWKENDSIKVKKHINQRFFWLQEIMDSYWSLAFYYMTENNIELFPLICKPFLWPVVTSFRHQILAKLVFFRQLECIKSCDEIRMDRIRDLSKIDHAGSSDETSIGGLILEIERQERISQYVTHIHFTVRPFMNGPNLQQKLDRLTIDNFKGYILIPDTREEIIETIRYSDLLYVNKTNFFTHAIRCVDIVKFNQNEVVVAGSSIPKVWKHTRYRLYRRYIDFTTMANIEGLKRIDQNEELVDVVNLIQDPNNWANSNVNNINFDINKSAIKLREEFSMSPSQKDISTSIFEKRLQIIWGPPGSGKTEFLALFVNWYIKQFSLNNSKSKDLLIGVTAFTRDAIYNLLKRIEKIQKRHGFDDLFKIIYVHGPKNDRKFEADSDMIGCPVEKSYTMIRAMKKTNNNCIFVMGATVWSWEKIRNKWKTFQHCDMMILDESTQLLVSDALLAVACLKKPNGKLIVAGDHMQLGPIIKNDYSDTVSRLNDPLLFGSIQQCLMRTKENHAIPTREFLLQKGALHDFGPNTLQLKDNWRMNEELNEFFKQVYGPDYISRYPKIKLHLDWEAVHTSFKKMDLIKSILNPDQSIALVKLKCTSKSQVFNMIDYEAKIVKQLVCIYLEAKVQNISKSQLPINRDHNEPNVMIVTPFHKQRIAIQKELGGGIPIDTVEKMQGQECDLIIACFSCSNKRANANEFIRDFRRWNVALSRARCKVIILTVDDIINPNPTEGILQSFDKTLEPTDGWALLCLLKRWAKEKNSTWDWPIDNTF